MNQTNAETRAWRFEIRHLFYLVALYAAAISLWGLIGAFPASLYLGLWLIYFLHAAKLRDIRIAAVVAAVFMFVVAIGDLQIVGIRHAARRSSCMNSMRQIILAMHNHESANKTLPKAVEFNDHGETWHSWRIALTPYLEASALYGLYDKDEPWNGPKNSKLLGQMPWVYSCPANKTETTTPYKLVTGPRTAFDDGKPFSIAGAHDSPSSIIVLIEDAANPVPWLKPEDLSVDEAIAILSSTSREHASHCFETKFGTKLHGNIVGLLDGRARFIPIGADPDILRQAFDAYDGIEPDLDFEMPKIKIIKWQGYISLGIFFFLLAIPIVLVGRKRRAN